MMKDNIVPRRPSQDIPDPIHGLWNLWDMLEIKALAFVNAIGRLSAIGATITTLHHQNQDIEDSAIPEKYRKIFRRDLKEISQACNALGATVSGQEVATLRNRMAQRHDASKSKL